MQPNTSSALIRCVKQSHILILVIECRTCFCNYMWSHALVLVYQGVQCVFVKELLYANPGNNSQVVYPYISTLINWYWLLLHTDTSHQGCLHQVTDNEALVLPAFQGCWYQVQRSCWYLSSAGIQPQCDAGTLTLLVSNLSRVLATSRGAVLVLNLAYVSVVFNLSTRVLATGSTSIKPACSLQLRQGQYWVHLNDHLLLSNRLLEAMW